MFSRGVVAIATAAVFCALIGAAVAQGLPDKLRGQLDALSSEQRDQVYRRHAMLWAMSPQQQQQFRQRLADWQALPAHERRQRRERWQAWQALPSEQQARMRGAAATFAALTVQEQLDLRERFDAFDDTQQRGWLLGPELGADWAQLEPLLMHVPTAQRAPLLDALREMSRQQRADLGVLAQRTPPQSRDELRKGLLATPASRRGPWLVEQLER